MVGDFDGQVAGSNDGGPEAVAAMVQGVRRQFADGHAVPGFTDKDEFLAHLKQRSRRSA